MFGEHMLNKQTIMAFIVTYVVINLLQDVWTFRTCCPKFKVQFIRYMNQNVNLEIIPMHILHFIMSLERIVLKKVNAREDCIIRDVF